MAELEQLIEQCTAEEREQILLAGLVGKEPDAPSPLLDHFTIPLMMGAAALVVAALLCAVFSDGETSQRADRPAEVGETSESQQPVGDAPKPPPEPQPGPESGPPLQAEAPPELGSIERKVDGVSALFPDAPPLAVAPFTAAEAKAHQQAWAKYGPHHPQPRLSPTIHGVSCGLSDTSSLSGAAGRG